MKMNHFPSEFQKAMPILEKILNAGYVAYFVGGCVRDVLLNHPIHDVDIATSATPNEISQLFSKTFDLGIQHGTIAVLQGGETYEITTFRTESEYEDFRRPDKVTFVRSLEEDLKRRDFTMNALAVDMNGELIDLFEGLKDIEKQEIRAVGVPEERFHEDALRMMRGVRFSSQLGFYIEEKTFQAIKKMHPFLEKIAIERVRVEFEKLLLGKYPAFGLQAFIETRLFEYTPGLKMKETALYHMQELLKNKELSNVTVAWTLLVFELQLSTDEVSSFLRSWKLSNDLIRKVIHLISFLPKHLAGNMEPIDIYHLGNDAIEDLDEVAVLERRGSAISELKNTFKLLPIKKRQELHLVGGDLLRAYDKSPGSWVGETLNYVEEEVVKGHLENDKEKILQEVEEHFKWSKHLL